MNRALGWFFDIFNRGFTATARFYSRFVGGMLRVFVLVFLVYIGLLFLTYNKFLNTPRGFIPSQDMGYLLVNIQLPDSAALERTQKVIHQISEIANKLPGVSATVGIAGQSLLLNAYGSNFGTMFCTLEEFKKRPSPSPLREAVENWLRVGTWGSRRSPTPPTCITRRSSTSCAANLPWPYPRPTSLFGPPPLRGVGRAGGWMLMIEDRGDLGSTVLQSEVENLVRKGNDGIDMTGTPIGMDWPGRSRPAH